MSSRVKSAITRKTLAFVLFPIFLEIWTRWWTGEGVFPPSIPLPPQSHCLPPPFFQLLLADILCIFSFYLYSLFCSSSCIVKVYLCFSLLRRCMSVYYLIYLFQFFCWIYSLGLLLLTSRVYICALICF